MNEIIKLGVINTLEITRFTDNGVYLKAQDEQEVLLPNAYVKKDMEVGDTVEVFIYTDSEDRLVATTTYPKAILNEFAPLKIVDVNKVGAFANIGLAKDLLIPFSNQKTKYNVGDIKVIRIIKDEHTNRLVGTEKLNKYFDTQTTALRKNQKVNVIVWMETELGFKVIVENRYEGLIFKNEIFENLEIGQIKTAYVKNKRKDGKLDISLQPVGKKNTKSMTSNIVVDKLHENGGFLPYNYKSGADDIANMFNMSKKNFKATLTKLLDEKKITLDEKGITLLHV